MCCESSNQAPQGTDNKFTNTLADISQAQWARNVSTFQPLENQLVQSVQQYQTPAYTQRMQGKAAADVSSAYAKAGAEQTAEQESMGTNPAEGRWGFMKRGLQLGQAGSTAAAVTGAGERAQQTAFNTLAGVSGRGSAMVGQSIGAAQAGGQLYNQSAALNLQQEQMNNAGWGGVGSLIGTGIGAYFASSKKWKTGAAPYSGGLKAIRAMPIRSWNYNKNTAPAPVATDTATHIGPYAEDFAKTTGVGDGNTINYGDAIGVTMNAIKQLDAKVSKIGRNQDWQETSRQAAGSPS